MDGLTSYRSSDDFKLELTGDLKIAGNIAQYMTSHQLRGVKTLYRNYQKNHSSILNDETGFGKCVQIVTFINAVIDNNFDSVIIVCPEEARQLHWCYHFTTFAPNVKLITFNASSECFPNLLDRSKGGVFLTTIDMVTMKNMNELKDLESTLLVLDEGYIFYSPSQLSLLDQLHISKKIIVSGCYILMNIEHFYYILNFCNQLGTLNLTKEHHKELTLHEFKLKFGSYGDKSLSQRNISLRLTNLLNICKEFYIRRKRSQITNNVPLINEAIFEKNFQQWKDAQKSQSEVPNNNLILNTADQSTCSAEPSSQILSQDFTNLPENMFELSYMEDTQMSPLIYENSDSDDEEILANNAIEETEEPPNSGSLEEEIPNGQTRLLSEMATIDEDNECASKITRAFSFINPAARITRSKIAAQSNISKKRLCKELDFETKDILERKLSDVRKISKRKSKQEMIREKSEYRQQKRDQNKSKREFERRTSNASDVQVISPRSSPPIFVASSSETLTFEDGSNSGEPAVSETNVNPSSQHLPSDIFDCSSSSDNSINKNHFKLRTPSPLHAGHVQERHSAQESPVETHAINTFDLFAEDTEMIPHSRNDLNESAIRNKTNDIFEVTKNTVIQNGIREALDVKKSSIGPETENSYAKPSRTVSSESCFRGLRLIIPRLRGLHNYTHVINEDYHSSTSKTESSKPNIIDLNESQEGSPPRRPQQPRRHSEDIVNLVSETSNQADIEKTPTKRQILTPSTRSCLKQRPCEKTASREKHLETLRPTVNGWLSKRKQTVNNLCGTPNSRRCLNKSFVATSKEEGGTPTTTTRPRNLFGSGGKRLTRSTSVCATKCPVIVLSSDEE